MAVGTHRRAIGTFSSHAEAERALHELRDAGFNMNHVSVIAKDSRGSDLAGAEVKDQRGNKADEGAATGAATGGALGALGGLLVGLGALAIPGVGPVMLAGATATALATTISGGAIGAVTGGLLGALVGLGIPEERARTYSNSVSRGDYLVIVEGSDSEIQRAETVLGRRGIQDWGIFDHSGAPVSSPASTSTSSTLNDTSYTANTTATADDLVTIIDKRDQPNL